MSMEIRINKVWKKYVCLRCYSKSQTKKIKNWMFKQLGLENDTYKTFEWEYKALNSNQPGDS